MKATMSVRALLMLACVTSVLPALAGPMTPPPGAPASTMKSLTEVEPRIAINATNTPGDANSMYRITQPGSYYLAGNVAGSAAKSGIKVVASNVTIDLGGFELTGHPLALYGVRIEGAIGSVSVSNGTLSSWPAHAISIPLATGVRIERVTIRDALVGIEASSQAVIESCVLTNTENGIYAKENSLIRGCTLAGVGVQGISAGKGSIVESCSIGLVSSAYGIYLSGGGSVARDCVVRGGAIGIETSVASRGSVIEACTITGASQYGVNGTGNATIRGSTVTEAGLIGILANNECVVENNVVRDCRGADNTASGIYAAGTRAVVRNNTLVNNGKGIRVASGGNAIYSNALTLNTQHLDIAANNRVGPVSTGPLSGAITTSTGGAGMGSTDPYANILY